MWCHPPGPGGGVLGAVSAGPAPRLHSWPVHGLGRVRYGDVWDVAVESSRTVGVSRRDQMCKHQTQLCRVTAPSADRPDDVSHTALI